MAFRRILAILLFVVGSVSAADNVKDGISMKLVVHVVPPRYPYELLHSGISGQGIVFGQVDYNTGNVTSVRMEKSTGNRALDRAALNAFHEWRFETGTVRQFRVPIKYEMRESGPRVMVGMDQAPGATDADVARRPRRDSGADPRGYTSADPYVHAVLRTN